MPNFMVNICEMTPLEGSGGMPSQKIEPSKFNSENKTA